MNRDRDTTGGVMINVEVNKFELFQCSNGSPFEFFVRKCFDRPRLVNIIEAGGGRVVDCVGPHTITLVPPLMAYYRSDSEAFGYDFVFECRENNEILSLDLFRIGPASQKYKDYNPNDILLQHLSWDDLQLQEEVSSKSQEFLLKSPKQQKEEALDQSNSNDVLVGRNGGLGTPKLHIKGSSIGDRNYHNSSSDDSEHEDKSPCMMQQSENYASSSCIKSESVIQTDERHIKRKAQILRPKTFENSPLRSKPTRREYSMQEQKQILRHIIVHNGYRQLKGVSFWKMLEDSNEVKDRSWQSMKEHFLKKIYPRINLFGLETDVLLKFRKGMTK